MPFPSRRVVIGLLVLTVIAIVCTIGGIVFSGPPKPPIYEGRSLEVWFALRHDKRIESDQWNKVVRSLGAEAVPWLTWMAEHGSTSETTEETGLVRIWWNKLKTALGLPPPNAQHERLTAICALASLGETATPAIPALARCLNSEGDDYTVSAAAFALTDLQPHSLDVLSKGMRSNSVDVRRAVAEKIEILHDSLSPDHKQTIILKRALTDPDETVASAALSSVIGSAHSMTPAQKREIVECLIPFIPRFDPWRGATLLYALRAYRDQAERAVPAVMTLLDSPDFEVRRCAAYLLGMIDQKEQLSRDKLVRMCEDSDFGCRITAKAGLAQFGIGCEAIVVELISLLNTSEPGGSIMVIECLGSIGPAASLALPALREIAERDLSPTVQQTARFAIGDIEESWSSPTSN